MSLYVPRQPLPDGTPDTSCEQCGGPTQLLVGGARCAAGEPCGWFERWSE